MFKIRLLSGILLLFFAIFIINIGSSLLLFFSLFLSLIGLYEIFNLFGLKKSSLSYLSYLLTITYYLLIYFSLEEYFSIFIILSLLSYLFIYVISFPKFKIEEVSNSFLALIYVGVLFSYLYKLRNFENGKYLVWLIFISSWGTDVSAYAIGILFGKHKIFPKLSPKKSLEGAIAGILGSVLFASIYSYIFTYKLSSLKYPILTCIISCFFASIISQLGDLCASAIKRNYNKKDFSNLIPGHGGILDRFDSILFVSPVIYFIIYFLQKL